MSFGFTVEVLPSSVVSLLFAFSISKFIKFYAVYNYCVKVFVFLNYMSNPFTPSYAAFAKFTA